MGAAQAAEVQVMSGGAVKSVVSVLAKEFEKESGHKVQISYTPMGVIRQKLAAGEAADVLIVAGPVFDDLAKQGTLAAASRSDIARVGVGVAVKEGATLPDISSAEKFRQTMLAARSVVYMDPGKGATSGVHVAGVLNKLGIADAMKAKTRLWPEGHSADAVASGDSEIAVQQLSELLPVKGITIVGPLPRELQMVSVYAAGLTSKAAQPDAARAFIAYVSKPEFRARFAQAGLDYQSE